MAMLTYQRVCKHLPEAIQIQSFPISMDEIRLGEWLDTQWLLAMPTIFFPASLRNSQYTVGN